MPRATLPFLTWCASARSSVWFHRIVGVVVVILWVAATSTGWITTVEFLGHVSMGTALYAVLGTLAPVKLAAKEEEAQQPRVSHDMPPRPWVDTEPLEPQRMWRDAAADYAKGRDKDSDDWPGTYL